MQEKLEKYMVSSEHTVDSNCKVSQIFIRTQVLKNAFFS